MMDGNAPARAKREYPTDAESALLLFIARADPRCDRAELVRLCARVTDWERLERASRAHALDPHAYRALADGVDGTVPTATLERLRATATLVAIRNVAYTRELAAIVHLLERAGVPSLALKGPTLARLAYDDLALRQFSDLDVLVHARDRARARAALADAGYRADGAAGASTLDQYHEVFVPAEGLAPLELHWGIARGRFGFRFDEEWWWRDRRRVDLPGAAIHTLSIERLLVYLCIHGSKHAWMRLSWVTDLAALARAQPALDWTQARVLAREAGADRMLSLGMRLAHELLDAPIPRAAIDVARRDPGVGSLVRQVRASLAAEGDAMLPSPDVSRFYLALHPGVRGKAAYLFRAFTAPSVRDEAWLPLPRGLRAGYRVVRPVRLVLEHAGRLVRGRRGER